jgi:hypothetical protein
MRVSFLVLVAYVLMACSSAPARTEAARVALDTPAALDANVCACCVRSDGTRDHLLER